MNAQHALTDEPDDRQPGAPSPVAPDFSGYFLSRGDYPSSTTFEFDLLRMVGKQLARARDVNAFFIDEDRLESPFSVPMVEAREETPGPQAEGGAETKSMGRRILERWANQRRRLLVIGPEVVRKDDPSRGS